MFLRSRLMIERRIFERITSKFPVKFKRASQDNGCSIELSDFSAQGIGIISEECLDINKQFDLEIQLPNYDSPLTFQGRVAWIKNDFQNDNWNVGLKFNRIELMRLSKLYQLSVA